MRQRFGMVMALLAVNTTAAFVWYRVPALWRALIFLPVMLSATGYLQASRNTCVARAREGTVEHDDLSKTMAPADEVEASRRVASTIQRDAILLGLGAAVLAVASALIR